MLNRFLDNGYRDTVKNQIINSYADNRLIPFVGAGLSKNIDGFPDWDMFIDELRKELCRKNIISDGDENGFKELRNPFEKTEFFVRVMGGKPEQLSTINEESFDKVYEKGRKMLLNRIKKILDPNRDKSKAKYDQEKWKIHDLLIEMFTKKIYTTNWDLVLESSMGACNKKVEIVKYHGDIGAYLKYIVACETDYMNRMSKDTHLDIIFKSDLLQNDFVFLGYSFRDPNIKFNLYQLREVINAARISYNEKVDLGKIYWITNEIHDITNLTLLSSMFSNIKIYLLFSENEGKNIKKACKKSGYDGVKKNKDGCLTCFTCEDNNSRINPKKKCAYQKKYDNETRTQVHNFLTDLKRSIKKIK